MMSRHDSASHTTDRASVGGGKLPSHAEETTGAPNAAASASMPNGNVHVVPAVVVSTNTLNTYPPSRIGDDDMEAGDAAAQHDSPVVDVMGSVRAESLPSPRDRVRVSGGTPTPSRNADAFGRLIDEQKDTNKSKKPKSREDRASRKSKSSSSKSHLSARSQTPQQGGVVPLTSNDGPTVRQPGASGHVPRSLFPGSAAGHCALSIVIGGMSPLRPSLKTVHPFVRVWLVDARSGLPFTAVARHAFAYTHPYDLRSRSSTAPCWNEELVLSFPRQVIADMISATCEPTLLFEVLDFGLTNIQGEATIPEVSYFHQPQAKRPPLLRICWAFLKLKELRGSPEAAGCAATRPRLNLQLFEFSHRRSAAWNAAVSMMPSFLANDACSAQQITYARPQAESVIAVANAVMGEGTNRSPIPDLYHVFANMNMRKVGYPGGLTVSICEVDAMFATPVAPEATQMERELVQVLHECISGELIQNSGNAADAEAHPRQNAAADGSGGGSNAFFTLVPTSSRFAREHQVSRTMAESIHVGNDFARRRGERVAAPSVLVHETLHVHGRITALDMSADGRCAALATQSTVRYDVQIREVMTPRFQLIGVLRGHLDYIHAVQFHPNGQFLVSISADRTARVWRVGDGPCFVNTSVDEQSICLAVLPVGVCGYAAVFHQDHVVTVGYDTRLLVWHVPQLTLGDRFGSNEGPFAPQVSGRRATAYAQLTASTNQPLTTPSAAPFLPLGSTAAARVSAVATNADTAFFLSVAALPTEETKLWTLDSGGSFVQWRAAVDDNPSASIASITSVSMRRRLECPGAASMQVCGMFACIAAPQDRAFSFVDLAAFVVIHKVSAQLSPTAGPQAWSMTADGRTVALGTPVTGALIAYDVVSGDVMTPPNGCPRARVAFPIQFMAWSRHQQLTIVAAPLGASSMAMDMPIDDMMGGESGDLSMVAVLGRPRRDDEVILDADPKAADYVRTTFGGEMQLARHPSARKQVHVEAPTPSLSRLKIAADVGDDRRGEGSSNKSTRIDQIMSFWKGLVAKHNDPSAAGKENAPIVKKSSASKLASTTGPDMSEQQTR
jgi:hypothetical protein